LASLWFLFVAAAASLIADTVLLTSLEQQMNGGRERLCERLRLPRWKIVTTPADELAEVPADEAEEEQADEAQEVNDELLPLLPLGAVIVEGGGVQMLTEVAKVPAASSIVGTGGGEEEEHNKIEEDKLDEDEQVEVAEVPADEEDAIEVADAIEVVDSTDGSLS
jgi:hypothetical protein